MRSIDSTLQNIKGYKRCKVQLGEMTIDADFGDLDPITLNSLLEKK